MIPETGADVAALIQMTLVPVVMINAIGLICLVIQNRHAVVVERVYKLNQERLRLQELLVERPTDARAVIWSRHLGEVNEMTHLWVQRGTLTRNALASAFLGITLFGLTSLWLVATALLSLPGPLAGFGLLLFTAGMLSFLVAFWFILSDLQQSLSLSRLDTQKIDGEVRSE